MPPAARPELLRADLKGWLFKLTEGVSIDGYSTYRAPRFSGAGLSWPILGDFRVPKDRMVFAPGTKGGVGHDPGERWDTTVFPYLSHSG